MTISPIMEIDTETGEGTVLGFSELGYTHGGDTFPSKVNICHRRGNGTYVPMEISMNALESHLAHGDIVPGVGGAPCGCPD